MIESDISEARSVFEQGGFVLLRQEADAELLTACERFVLTTNEWIRGDESTDSWLESAGALPQELVSHLPLSLIPQIADAAIVRHVAWFNVFGPGESIPAHKDASGDIQLLICIEAPESASGGQIWLKSPDGVLVMNAGDVLIFEASRLLHGTTPISHAQTKRRITLNIRAWTKKQVRNV